MYQVSLLHYPICNVQNAINEGICPLEDEMKYNVSQVINKLLRSTL
jgi:hypothetical protein